MFITFPFVLFSPQQIQKVSPNAIELCKCFNVRPLLSFAHMPWRGCGNLFFVSCLINPSDYTRGGWLTRRPIPKAKYMTLGPKFFCCSKMAVTRRISKLWWRKAHQSKALVELQRSRRSKRDLKPSGTHFLNLLAPLRFISGKDLLRFMSGKDLLRS